MYEPTNRLLSWNTNSISRVYKIKSYKTNFEEKRERRAFQEQGALGLILELEKRVNMNVGNEDVKDKTSGSRLSEEFSLGRENPAYFKNSDLTLSLKRGILALARISQCQQPQFAISRPGEATLAQARIFQYSPGFHPPRKDEIMYGYEEGILMSSSKMQNDEDDKGYCKINGQKIIKNLGPYNRSYTRRTYKHHTDRQPAPTDESEPTAPNQPESQAPSS
ncbi:hypothetical protein Lal_00026467 [Lupinus albus]|nr:hypothetical protein Lal_00026467 [Lupinus albus]